MRALSLAAVGLATLTLSARVLDCRVYFFAWANLLTATVLSLALTLILVGATRHRPLLTIFLSTGVIVAMALPVVMAVGMFAAGSTWHIP